MSTAMRVRIAAMTLWILAGSSEAGTLEIRFALAGGQIAVASAGIGASNPQTMFTGTARIVLTGVDPLGAITDPEATASLLGVDVETTLTVPALGGTIPFRFTQQGAVTGGFDGMTLGIPALTLTIRSTNVAGGMFDFANQMALAVRFAFLDTPGAGQFVLDGTLGDSGASLRFDIVGREVLRTFSAPEPREICLMTMALTLLAAACAWRSRSE